MANRGEELRASVGCGLITHKSRPHPLAPTWPLIDRNWNNIQGLAFATGSQDIEIMIPSAYVEHQLPGRLRLRVPEKRGDQEYFESVRKALSRDPAIDQLKVNPATASILLHHNGAAEPVTTIARERGLFEVSQGLVPAARASASQANGGRLLPGGLNAVANALAGLALLQVNRGQAFGNASENFWNAYAARRFLQQPGVAALFAAVGAYQVLRGRFLGSATSLLFYSLVTRQLAANEGKAEPSSAAAANKLQSDREKRSDG